MVVVKVGESGIISITSGKLNCRPVVSKKNNKTINFKK